MPVGLAGVGKMGRTVAQRLASLGHQVSVWNRSPARAQPQRGPRQRRQAHGFCGRRRGSAGPRAAAA
jgi:3-hydroxyisobutyrate dehydrogenase-like beta-hydroxyacid dehydrogenase